MIGLEHSNRNGQHPQVLSVPVMAHRIYSSVHTLVPPSIAVHLRLRSMRPFVFFSTFLSLFFAAALVAADQQEIIGNQDKRIGYTDGWFSVSIRAPYT